MNVYDALDARDFERLQRSQEALFKRIKPEVGDWIEYPDSRTPRRVAHVYWGEEYQPAVGGSFYLDQTTVHFSGELSPSKPIDTLEATDKLLLGNVWFFHHEVRKANNSVHTQAHFRVWKSTAPLDHE